MEFGCHRPTLDLRDFKLAKTTVSNAILPQEYSCPNKMAVKDQMLVSSCVAHAMSSILEYHAVSPVKLSTNFIYGSQRKLFNRTTKGMFLRDACKIAADYGDMLLEDCAGNTEVPACFEKAEAALADQTKLNKAKVFRVLKYFNCTSIDDIKYTLFNHGPVLASIRWYKNYTTKLDGTLTGKQKGDYGYHAFVIYGYNTEGFLCQNSWGVLWGKMGKFILPYNIALADAWGFIDVDNDDEVRELIETRPNRVTDILFKILNALINFFTKVFDRK